MLQRFRTTLRRIATSGRNDHLREQWESRTEAILFLLAAAMVPLLIGPYVADLDDATELWFIIADGLIWVLFAIDLAVRTWLAEHRIRFLKAHPVEVLIVLVPFLRPLRVLRVIVVFFRASQLLRRRGVGGSLMAALVAIVLASLVVGIAEQDGDGGINDWGTALWWALATITTVGYGDVVPVTAVGRIAGTVLMLVGIGVFGVLTANVAAWFVQQDDSQEQMMADISSLRAEVQHLRTQLAEGTSNHSADADPRND